MDNEVQLKLQAWLDGEVPEAEAARLSELLARDRDAAGLLEELRNTTQALEGFETDVRLPESREFFWSKVQRDIARLEAPTPKPAPTPLSALLRRFLIPATAVAFAFVGGLMLTRPNGALIRVEGPEAETALADAGAFTYRDYSKGTTLVWLSYPADNEVADDEELGTVE